MLKVKKNKIIPFCLSNYSLDSSRYFFIVFFIFVFQNNFAQLTLNPTLTPMQLAQTIVGAGYQVSNAKFIGKNGSIGTFINAGSNIGITDGILLTSGSINVANGPNNLFSAGFNNGTSGDSDLDNLSGTTTFDGCSLEFDLIPACDSLIINYVFASEEYPEYVNKQFNDVFAFFISGPGIVGTQNIALVPSTNLPVSINNINAGSNAQYFVSNASGATIQYDGFTTPLYAKAQVVPCLKYHLKIVIADVVDGIFDSGVFIKGNTIQCSPVSYNDVASNVNAITTCANGSFTFCRTGPQTAPFIVKYSIAGTAINGVDYVYIPDSVIIPANQQCQIVNLVPIFQSVNMGVGTVKIIYQLGFCPQYDTLTLTISDPPAIDAGPDVEICSGDSIKIGPISSVGITYSWQPTTGLSNPNIADPKISLVNNGNTDQIIKYVLSITNPQIGVCVLKDSLLVKVKPLPKAKFNSIVDYCIYSNVPYSDSSSAALGKNISAWYWDFGNNLFSNSQHPSVSYSTTGTFIVTLTVTDNVGCTNDTSQVVNVWPKPIVSFTSNASCHGDSVHFINNSTIPGVGFVSQSIWSFGDGTPLISLASPSHLYTSSNNSYNVQLIVTSDKNCVSSSQQPVVIRPKPIVQFTASSVCFGSPNKFFNSSTGINDFWDFGDGTTDIVRNPNHQYLAPGTYNVKLVSTTSYGCVDSITSVAMVYDIPKFNFTMTDTSGCPEVCTTFNSQTMPGSAPIVSWIWLFDFGSTGSGNQDMHCYSEFGVYSPALIAITGNGCRDTVTKTSSITVYPKPNADFSFFPNPLSKFDPTAYFTDKSSSDVISWAWNFGDGTSSSVSSPGAHQYPLDKDEYLAHLIVTNNYGCIDTNFYLIKIQEESAVYVPNAFTPNEDGKNEEFRPYCTGDYEKANYEMVIYDRWGMLIYRTDELNKGWNGQLNDEICQQDVYVYVIKFWNKSEGTLLKKLVGKTTLIK